MNIALDVMGGDFAPEIPIDGAIEALNSLSYNDKIILVGDENLIHDVLDSKKVDRTAFAVVNASETISMNEPPTLALSRKKSSSIAIGYKLVKNGQADAFVGAGNTGAMLVGSVYSLNMIPGIIRPCIPALIPRANGKGHNLVLDVGTNPDARPDVLYQYGIIGSVYAGLIMGIKSPKVSLLNIGEEEEKGSMLTLATHRLMKDTNDFNFIGNIEARNIFEDIADVIVCDGFTGNIILKQIEGFYNLLIQHNVKEPFFQRYNYENYGGTPVLGVNGITLIAHGISNAAAIKAMILEAGKIYKKELVSELKKALKKFIA